MYFLKELQHFLNPQRNCAATRFWTIGSPQGQSLAISANKTSQPGHKGTKCQPSSALKSAIAAPALIAAGRLNSASAAVTLKISHQFPGGTLEEGDFRDRMCQNRGRTREAHQRRHHRAGLSQPVADEDGAVRHCAKARSISACTYFVCGRRISLAQHRLMPGLVSSYPQSAAWKTSPIGQKFSAFFADKGVVILSWIWRPAKSQSRGNPIVQPEDAKGQKFAAAAEKWTRCCRPPAPPLWQHRQTNFTPPCRPALATPPSPRRPA